MIELAQFHVNTRSGDPQSKPPSAPARGLYQASSKGGGCNLARFGSPEPGPWHEKNKFNLIHIYSKIITKIISASIFCTSFNILFSVKMRLWVQSEAEIPDIHSNHCSFNHLSDTRINKYKSSQVKSHS